VEDGCGARARCGTHRRGRVRAGVRRGRPARHRAGWRTERPPEARTIRNAERKALDALGLDVEATSADIKARFKLLVKRHHPDANGGDRSCEDKLRQIIQAYNYLKSVGFC
jgi:DnaJ-domain-containing protein 1